MTRHTTITPRGIVAGLGLGLALAWGMGAGQASAPVGSQPAADPVERELALLHGGLFREQSLLPQDPSRSIEQMLEEQAKALDRLQARLAGLDTGRLDAIQQRLADFERTMSGFDTSGVGRMDSDMQSVRRGMDDLTRTVERLERDEIAKIERSLDELARDSGSRNDRSLDTIERDLRDLKSTIQDVKRTVEAIERRRP